jgi:hypothetical protein
MQISRRRVLLAALTLSATAPGAAGAQSIFDQGAKLLQGLGSSVGGALGGDALSNQELVNGLKEALKVGTGSVVSQLGAKDGFNANPDIRIPLPQTLEKVRSTLAPFGMAGMLDDLELRLNRAAETATPKAKQMFLDAISKMTLDDARAIYEGNDDAATQYFKGKMTAPLTTEFKPVVDESLSEVGAIKAYDSALGEYSKLPFMPDAKANLSEYVIERGLDGMFLYLAREEAAIRANPAKRTTELLQRVFGQ